jgi:hypothetical protein
MTNNTEKKNVEQTTTEEPIEVLFERYNSTISEVNVSPEAKAALEFIAKFGAKAEDLPIPDGVKAELIKVSECKQNKEEVLRAVHQRYEALTEKRNAITSQMDAIQAFLKRTTGKTSGKIGRPRKTAPRGNGSTVTGIWHVTPADIMEEVEVEIDEDTGKPKSISTGYIKSVCPICGEILAGGYNSAKQHIARHEEAVERGWVSW